MNYYRRYLGDYMRDTMHLSLLEHGAYTLLLDACYATERVLPAPYEALYRLCRAMTKPEQTAVKSVADQFFPVGVDGLRHNARADHEIGIAQSTIAKQRESGVESAAKRWSTDRSTYKSTTGSSIQPPTTNHQPPASSLQEKSTPPAPSASALDAGDAAKGNGKCPCYIPLVDGTEYGITTEQLEELGRLYPAVDVPQTLNEIRGWNLSHPTKRKTRRGVLSHITGWLAKEQNRG